MSGHTEHAPDPVREAAQELVDEIASRGTHESWKALDRALSVFMPLADSHADLVKALEECASDTKKLARELQQGISKRNAAEQLLAISESASRAALATLTARKVG